MCVRIVLMTVFFLLAPGVNHITLALDITTPPAPILKPHIQTNSVQKAQKTPSYKINKTDFSDFKTSDINLYTQIRAVQEKGQWDKADGFIAKLKDHRLMGYVLHQRYMHPVSYRSKYAELKSWLVNYGDHAGARDIYELALMRKDGNAGNPPRPQTKKGLFGAPPHFIRPKNMPKYKNNSHSKKIAKAIDTNVLNDLKCCGAATRALERLNTADAKTHMTTHHIDILKGKIANTYLHLDHTSKALETGGSAASRSGEKAYYGAWVAGLAAWQKNMFVEAALYFDAVAASQYASEKLRAAGAYWASRAYLRQGLYRQSMTRLQSAAQEPRVFYGLLARVTLGQDVNDLDWRVPALTPENEALILENIHGFRAYWLLKAGYRLFAEQELMQITPKRNDALKKALLAFASYHRLPAVQYRTSTAIRNPQGKYYDAALFPEGKWGENFPVKETEKPLIYALIRKESRFDVFARAGSSGATGLMQLLPSTATYIDSQNYKGQNRYKLFNPETNITLGHRYVHHLLGLSEIKGNMFKLLVGYNAGPGNLRRWWRDYKHKDDPLLFIETIPVSETRQFVEYVMTSYWLYRMRYGLPVPSLQAVSSGQWPIYEDY